MNPEGTQHEPILGICDRCGKDILKRKDTEMLVLKATNIKYETETYSLHFILCDDCRRDFRKWIFQEEDTI